MAEIEAIAEFTEAADGFGDATAEDAESVEEELISEESQELEEEVGEAKECWKTAECY